VLLLEREAQAGGLCRSETIEGFCFDKSPHIIHVRNPAVRDLLIGAPGKFARHSRRAVVYLRDRFIPYPIECHLAYFETADREDYVLGLLNRPRHELKNFMDWIQVNFGENLARDYFIPYNRKIWTIDPREMDIGWMGNFVPTLHPRDVVAGLFAAKENPAGYNATFWYPVRGGIWEYARGFTGAYEEDRTVLNAVIQKIDLDRKTVVLETGREIHYQVLVSTIPLKDLIQLSGGRESPTRRPLWHTTVTVVHLGFDRIPRWNGHWIYVPQPEFVCYRISIPSNYSQAVSPPGCSLLTFEIAGRGPAAEINRDVLSHLEECAVRMGIFSKPASAIFHFASTIPCAYTIPLVDQNAEIQSLIKDFQERDVFSVGRIGGWKYSSMEDAILLGPALSPEIGRRLGVA
jgi:protoporphyrinogen oxidase